MEQKPTLEQLEKENKRNKIIKFIFIVILILLFIVILYILFYNSTPESFTAEDVKNLEVCLNDNNEVDAWKIIADEN